MGAYLEPVSTIEADLGIENGGEIHAFFTDQCAKHMDKYVPYDKGDLSSYEIEGVDKIHYDQLYAHYQYKGERQDGTHKIDPNNRNRSMHHLATSYWDQHMVTAEGPIITKEVELEIKKRGGK